MGESSAVVSTMVVSTSMKTDAGVIGEKVPGPERARLLDKKFLRMTFSERAYLVPKDFKVEEGYTLADNLVVGKKLGGGMQGGVYDLRDAQGNKAPWVLKVQNPGAVLGDLEKEWAIGMALDLLQDPETGRIPGFMKTGSCIRTDDKSRTFRGMLLERITGREVNDTLSQPGFHDIGYVRDFLFQTFAGLMRAQELLGFHHADCRLVNVMDHYPNLPETTPREFKVIDFGLSQLLDTESSAIKRFGRVLKRQAVSAPSTAKLFMHPKQAANATLDKGYRLYWISKGDVFHLLWSLLKVIDGLVWCEEDRQAVEGLVELVKYVTGVKVRTYFGPRGPDGHPQLPAVKGFGHIFYRKDKAVLYAVRRLRIRFQGFMSPPMHTNCSAKKALDFKFFDPLRPQLMLLNEPQFDEASYEEDEGGFHDAVTFQEQA